MAAFRTSNMGHWNYRVMRTVDASTGETQFSIHEVYYDPSGEVNGWTQEPCGSPFGETPQELAHDLAWITKALMLPVLDSSDGKICAPAIGGT